MAAIGTPPNEANTRALAVFQFDEVYPFPAIFAGPIQAYTCSMISFSGSLKGLDEDADRWLHRFEMLLGTLEAIQAEVIIESQETPFRRDVAYYLCEGRWQREDLQNRT